MKHLLKLSDEGRLAAFISHTVQMKLRDGEEPSRPLRVFISHTVQMKRKQQLSQTMCRFKLYIPHGSDETPGRRFF